MKFELAHLLCAGSNEEDLMMVRVRDFYKARFEMYEQEANIELKVSICGCQAHLERMVEVVTALFEGFKLECGEWEYTSYFEWEGEKASILVCLACGEKGFEHAVCMVRYPLL